MPIRIPGYARVEKQRRQLAQAGDRPRQLGNRDAVGGDPVGCHGDRGMQDNSCGRAALLPPGGGSGAEVSSAAGGLYRVVSGS